MHMHKIQHTCTHIQLLIHTRTHTAFQPNKYRAHLQNSPGEYHHRVSAYFIPGVLFYEPLLTVSTLNSKFTPDSLFSTLPFDGEIEVA